MDSFEVINIFSIIHTHTKQENTYGICIYTQEHKHIFTHTHTHTHIQRSSHILSDETLSFVQQHIPEIESGII